MFRQNHFDPCWGMLNEKCTPTHHQHEHRPFAWWTCEYIILPLLKEVLLGTKTVENCQTFYIRLSCRQRSWRQLSSNLCPCDSGNSVPASISSTPILGVFIRAVLSDLSHDNGQILVIPLSFNGSDMGILDPSRVFLWRFRPCLSKIPHSPKRTRGSAIWWWTFARVGCPHSPGTTAAAAVHPANVWRAARVASSVRSIRDDQRWSENTEIPME